MGRTALGKSAGNRLREISAALQLDVANVCGMNDLLYGGERGGRGVFEYGPEKKHKNQPQNCAQPSATSSAPLHLARL